MNLGKETFIIYWVYGYYTNLRFMVLNHVIALLILPYLLGFLVVLPKGFKSITKSMF